MYKQEGYNLVGVSMEVYNAMGNGFLEDVYQESLEFEMNTQSIPFESQPKLELYYKAHKLEKYYRPDLYVYDGIVAELKAVKKILPEHEAQLLNYLKASRKRVGYLLNFGHPEKLEWKRYVV